MLLSMAWSVPASLTKPLQDEPCRLLRNAYFLRKLKGGNALAHGNQQVHSVNPLVKRHMASLKNSAGADGEIFLAGVATVVAAFPASDPFPALACGALRAIRPESPFKIFVSRLCIREHP